MTAVVNGNAKPGAAHLDTHVARRWAEARVLGEKIGEYPPDEPHVETMPAFRNALLGLSRWAQESADRLDKRTVQSVPITPQTVEAVSMIDLPAARRTALEFIRQRIEQNSMAFRTIAFTDALRAAGGERHKVAILLEFERDAVLIPLPSVRSEPKRPGGDFKDLIVPSGPTEWRIGPGALAALTVCQPHDGAEGDEPAAKQPTGPPPASTAEKLPDPWVSYCGGAFLCSSDFGTVRRGDEEFRLTSNQRACIGFMIGAWQKGRREFTNLELLEAVGSSADSIRNVFRSNGKSVPAWNSLIVEVEGKKGKYTLRVSEKPLN
jgi:hypothetical protein